MVRSLVALAISCEHARELAQEDFTTLRAKLAELKALERSIAAFVATCEFNLFGRPWS